MQIIIREAKLWHLWICSVIASFGRNYRVGSQWRSQSDVCDDKSICSLCKSVVVAKEEIHQIYSPVWESTTLWPKQHNLVQSKWVVVTLTISEPLSVVMHTCLEASKFHESRVPSKASATYVLTIVVIRKIQNL